MEAMRDMFGPGHVDQTVRSAVQACWMALPKERRTVEEVEKQLRRLMERAISNLHEDVAAFGGPK
jgi:BMFP domain-containing protein YqiC